VNACSVTVSERRHLHRDCTTVLTLLLPFATVVGKTIGLGREVAQVPDNLDGGWFLSGRICRHGSSLPPFNLDVFSWRSINGSPLPNETSIFPHIFVRRASSTAASIAFINSGFVTVTPGTIVNQTFSRAADGKPNAAEKTT
jgi:hypothetical protein